MHDFHSHRISTVFLSYNYSLLLTISEKFTLFPSHKYKLLLFFLRLASLLQCFRFQPSFQSYSTGLLFFFMFRIAFNKLFQGNDNVFALLKKRKKSRAYFSIFREPGTNTKAYFPMKNNKRNYFKHQLSKRVNMILWKLKSENHNG